MDDRKICFITCSDDDTAYRESLYYLNRLTVPDGFDVEFLRVNDVRSLPQGYNQAMAASDAKYKVYLRQNVCIIERGFLSDLIYIFENHADIGMVAAAGGRRLLPDGIWKNACEKFGVFLENSDGRMRCCRFGDETTDLQDIQAAANCWIATQADVPFREDGPADSAFCESSQSLEFTRRSLRVVVPAWQSPSCMCFKPEQQQTVCSKGEQETFLDAYSKDLFPPVSILIPAYNQTRFLQPALESALSQTYRNIEVLVSDDSTNDEVCTFIQPYLEKYSHLRYVKNPPHEPDYGISNTQNCINESQYEYISFLFHDDSFESEKTADMMSYAIAYPDLSLITSSFYYIDESGAPISLVQYFDRDTRMDGAVFIQHMLNKRLNIVGPPSAALIRKSVVNPRGWSLYETYPCSTATDVALWFSALEHGNAAYIAKPLCRFRISTTQNSQKPEILIGEQSDWLELLMHSHQRNHSRDTRHYLQLLCQYIGIALQSLSQNFEKVKQYKDQMVFLQEAIEKATETVFSLHMD